MHAEYGAIIVQFQLWQYYLRILSSIEHKVLLQSSTITAYKVRVAYELNEAMNLNQMVFLRYVKRNFNFLWVCLWRKFKSR